jgi:hypothetical protein
MNKCPTAAVFLLLLSSPTWIYDPFLRNKNYLILIFVLHWNLNRLCVWLTISHDPLSFVIFVLLIAKITDLTKLYLDKCDLFMLRQSLKWRHFTKYEPFNNNFSLTLRKLQMLTDVSGRSKESYVTSYHNING